MKLRRQIDFSAGTVPKPEPEDKSTDVPSLDHVIGHHWLLQRFNSCERLTQSGPPPVRQQFLLVQAGPFKHQSERSRRKGPAGRARFDSTVILYSPYTAWKWGGPCSLKNMPMTMPRNLEISGIA